MFTIKHTDARPAGWAVYESTAVGSKAAALCFTRADAERVASALEILAALGQDSLRLATRADGRWMVLNVVGTQAAIEEKRDEIRSSQKR